jgi:hypothetical protein
MHKESNSFRLSKILTGALVTYFTLATIIKPGRATAQDNSKNTSPDIQMERRTEEGIQDNPYMDAFFGSFDKDVKKGKTGKAVANTPIRIVGTPFKALYGLGVTAKRTGHTIAYGTDEQKDSGLAIAGRVILSPFIYLGHLVTGTGKYVKENPVQAVSDAATLGAIGYYGIYENTRGESTNRAPGEDGTPGGPPGVGP